MKIRSILMAGVAGSVLAAAPIVVMPAMAQTQSTPQATSPSATMPAANAMKVDSLVGKSVRNAQGDKIGDIEAVFVTPNGQIDSVMVSVGGFLGMGEREVAVKWSDLKVSADGETITSNMTKDSLKALPEYTYKDKTYRGRAFSDAGVYNTPGVTPTNKSARDDMARTDPARRDTARTDTARTDTPRTERPAVTGTPRTDAPRANTTTMRGTTGTKAFTKTGEMSADALIGATVRNTADESVGEIKDIHFNADGSIKGAVVGVGGFLGMGERDVLMPWKQLKIVRDGERDAVVRIEASKDSLKAMPEYQM